jgi:hypothetical protein
MVTAGPIFQVLRGLFFEIAFYALHHTFFSEPRGWTSIRLVLIFVSILSPFSAPPGSIEGVVRSTLPPWFHIFSLPELLY